jgi:hypothetical protein
MRGADGRASLPPNATTDPAEAPALAARQMRPRVKRRVISYPM